MRNQRRFGFAPDGSLRLLTTAKPQGAKRYRRQVLGLFLRRRNDDDPYGIGLAHWLY